MALCVFSSFVSSITATMTRIREINNQLAEQEASLRSFFAEHHISLGLAKQVWHYLKFHGKPAIEKRQKIENVSALTFLPESLKQDLRMEIFVPILNWHPLFRDARLTPEALTKIVNETLSEKSLRMNEELFTDWRSKVKHMGFVATGGLLYADGSEDPAMADAGSWVCEAALWIEDAELEWPLVARAAGTEVVLMNAQKLQDLLAKNSKHTLKLLAQYAAHFCAAFNLVLREQMTDVSPLFNDPQMAEDLAAQSMAAHFLGSKRTFAWRGRFSEGHTSQRTSRGPDGFLRKTQQFLNINGGAGGSDHETRMSEPEPVSEPCSPSRTYSEQSDSSALRCEPIGVADAGEDPVPLEAPQKEPDTDFEKQPPRMEI